MRPVQRREVLGLLVGAALGRRAFAAPVAPRAARDAVDHVVIGVADLDKGVAVIEDRLGVRPTIGGSHPGRGTWNALFSLGPSQYAELVAPDPKQKGTPDAFGLSGLAEPRFLVWAASSPDIDALLAQVQAAGHAAEIRPGSRVRPDGRKLGWRTLSTALKDPLLPFFIQWDAGSVHPSADSPAGCSLLALEFEGPDPAASEKALAVVGLQAKVAQAPAARLKLRIRSPKGDIAL